MENKKYAHVYTGYPEGFNVSIVKVEANIKKGIPRYIITGQPDIAIRESIDRIRVAMENSGFHFPMQNLVINLSPAGFRKTGSFFDLPIIMSILTATSQINHFRDQEKTVILGEVGLNGKVNKIKGIVNILLYLKKSGFDRVIIPAENLAEASVVSGLKIFSLDYVKNLKLLLTEDREINLNQTRILQPLPVLPEISLYPWQIIALRGLQISLAGRHHMLMTGSPGSGKTMISRLGKILQPPLDEEETSGILRIESLKGNLGNEGQIVIKRPFRSPHHTSSDVAIVGGGHQLQMGEITLAHNGILFLDELAEFRPRVIQSLREPMEEQQITIARANGRVTYPAGFLLLCATNPCPCGYFNSKVDKCFCSTQKVKNYLSRFNGPFLDRIEIEIELYKDRDTENKVQINLHNIHESIVNAALLQKSRFRQVDEKYNGVCRHYNSSLLKIHQECTRLIKSIETGTSPRKLHSLVKISRTIADLEGSEEIREHHIYEALHFCDVNRTLLKKAG